MSIFGLASGPAGAAIIGSGVSTEAIIGSGVSSQAIIGSGVSTEAIIGSGVSSQAIIGSGVSAEAIIGSGRSTQAIIGSGSPFDLAAVGAAELGGEGLTVLGQTVHITSATQFHAGSSEALSSGRLVAIFGLPASNGVWASDVLFLPGRFVEGSSATFIAGYVTEGSDDAGVFKIGSLAVIPAQAGSDPEAWNILPGTLVRITGVVFDGRLFVNSIKTD
jgi:hypothetical protein